jgi:hypothetical protein
MSCRGENKGWYGGGWCSVVVVAVVVVGSCCCVVAVIQHVIVRESCVGGVLEGVGILGVQE